MPDKVTIPAAEETRKKTATFTWLRGFMSRYLKAVACALALGLIASACAALLMFTSGYLISATALATTTLFSVLVPVACVQLFGFGRPLARYLERLMSHSWVLKLTSDLRLALFKSIEQRTGDPERERAAGDYLALLADDIAHLQNLYLRVVFPTVVAYMLAVGAAIVFGWFSVPFALVMLLCFALVVVLLPFGSLLATRARTELVKEARAREFASVTDDVQGASDWLLSGRSRDALLSHAEADVALRKADSQVRTVKRLFSLASTLLHGALLAAVLAWAAGMFASGSASANWIAAFALGFFALIESFSILPEALGDYTVHEKASERLREYLEPVDGAADTADNLQAPSSGDVTIANVSYSYPQARNRAVDALSLDIPAGQNVAVLGRSGSGKSTLANLICGTLTCDEGEISIGGINVDRSVDIASTVGYLDQKPYLFNRSLRDNLALASKGASDEEIEAVLARVGLEEKLTSLPHGLDTVIGETGVGFSGGEAHRIAIARILLAHVPVVVVDEPFSALDPETEEELLEVLLDTFSDCTLVVITHHLAHIERFDRVIAIEHGTLRLDGSPTQLVEESAWFKSLIDFDRANC